MATKKIFLVDTENVGSTWKDLLPAKTGSDQILLFFTENSPYVSYTDLQLILQFPDRFEMIKCNPGKNGLDFQLVSYLGYLMKTASKANYVIVSNDSGFDAVVKFWQDRGMTVSRMNVYHVLQPDAAPVQETAAVPASPKPENQKGRRGRPAASGQKATAVHRDKTMPAHAVTAQENPAKTAATAVPDTHAESVPLDEPETGSPVPSDAAVDSTATANREGNSSAADVAQADVGTSAGNENPPAVSADVSSENTLPDNALQENAGTFDADTAKTDANAPSGSTAKTAKTPAKRQKKAAAATLAQPPEPAVSDPENMELDFSNLTVSEKASLLRKYLPKEFSENQESLDIISDIMFGHDTTNHHQLHLAFVKNFGDEKGTLIYKAFRPHLAEFRA